MAARPVRRAAGWLAAALAGLLATACADVQPKPFPDARENPTFPGLLTGPSGEWVIDRNED